MRRSLWFGLGDEGADSGRRSTGSPLRRQPPGELRQIVLRRVGPVLGRAIHRVRQHGPQPVPVRVRVVGLLLGLSPDEAELICPSVSYLMTETAGRPKTCE